MKAARLSKDDKQYRCGLCLSFVRVGEYYHDGHGRLIVNHSGSNLAYHPRCIKKAGKKTQEVVRNEVVLEQPNGEGETPLGSGFPRGRGELPVEQDPDSPGEPDSA